jgi:serine protease Do
MANEAAQDAASKAGNGAAPPVGDSAAAQRDDGAAPPPPPPKYDPPKKADVNRDTVLRWIDAERAEREKKSEVASRVWVKERETSKRAWQYSVMGLGAAVAVVTAGGGWFYWKHLRDQSALRAEQMRQREEIAKQEKAIAAQLQQEQAKVEQQTAALEKKQKKILQQQEEERHAAEEQKKAAGMTAQEIANTFGNATVRIDRAWRLYDKTTGLPIFHQKFTEPVDIGGGKKEKRELPAYVKLPVGGKVTVVRWLTIDSDQRSNIPIGGEAWGSGFVVSDQGHILTNKHVAAPWKLSFGSHDPANGEKYNHKGLLYDYGAVGVGKKGRISFRKKFLRVIDLQNGPESKELFDWVPANGGYVFMKDLPVDIGEKGNIPDASKGGNVSDRTFSGRLDRLEVQFANSRAVMNGSLVNFSNYSDAALIKVDTPQPLKKLDIAKDDAVRVGEPVVVLGFPGVAASTLVESETIEGGQHRTVTDTLPQPFVTEGIVSVVSPALKTDEKGVTVAGLMGDVIQMSINSTGGGNSGGPVFNKYGEVIGLFTYGISDDVQTSAAIPIKYGRDLFMSRHP